MATRTIEVRTCDICGSDDRVEDFQISGSPGVSVLDVCSVHAVPLLDLMAAGRLRRRPGRKPAGSASAALTARADGAAGRTPRRTAKKTSTAAARKTTRATATKNATKRTSATKRTAAAKRSTVAKTVAAKRTGAAKKVSAAAAAVMSPAAPSAS